MPADAGISSVSLTVGGDQIAEESSSRSRTTARCRGSSRGRADGPPVEIPQLAVVAVRDGKFAHEHIWWDQASCPGAGRPARPRSRSRLRRRHRRSPAATSRRVSDTPRSPRAARSCSARTATSGSTTGSGCANATTPQVLAYLEAENAYTRACWRRTEPPAAASSSRRSSAVSRRPTPPRRSARGRTSTSPAPIEGRQYGVHCRRPAGTPGLPDPFAAPGTRTRRGGAARRERARRPGTTTSRSATSP